MADMRLIVTGAGGRMGRTLVRALSETPGARLVAAIEAPASPFVGQDSGVLAGLGANGIAVGSDLARQAREADGIIDFTTPAATIANVEISTAHGLVHVIGTTGLDGASEAAIREAAKKTVIIKAGNMSLGVNLLVALTRKVAAALGEDFDIEIVEMHHRNKVDAPSGNALMLGQAAAEGRGVSLTQRSVRARDGHTGPRTVGDIGFATLRGGSVVGDHTVIFAGDGERIELTRLAADRGIFARGQNILPILQESESNNYL